MQLSRDYAMKELIAIRDSLAEWIVELENPAEIDSNGQPRPLFRDGVPPGTAVEQLGLPILQFRAELAGLAARLEALAVSG